jgi:hypothetical protein
MKYLNVKASFNRLFLLAAIICCCSFCATAQAPVVPAAAKPSPVKAATVVSKGAIAKVDTFFKKYKEEGNSAAIDYLFGTNKLFTDQASINVLKAKLDSLQKTVGQYLGKELISQKSASASLIFYSYLVKFTAQPIRFTFMFYKPQNDWVLYRFKYDDQMDGELEEAGRINNKRP